MFEFTLGFMSGCLVIGITWKMVSTTKNVFIIRDETGKGKLVEQPNKVVHPDNKKAQYFSSDKFRNELAYVNAQKEKRSKR